MSDPLALGTRSGLPQAQRCLLSLRPRETWGAADLHPTARFWLQMHQGFRHQQTAMERLIADVRDGRAETRAAHPRLIGVLGGFLQHLDGHHRIESGHYFPQFRRIEPRVVEGLDLLDRDHDAVHARLEALHGAGLDFHHGVQAGAADVDDRLNRLGDVLAAAGPLLIQHLDDEEEIVIPLVCAHGAG